MPTSGLIRTSVLLAGLTLAGGLAAPASAADGLIATHRISASLANEAVGAAVAACAAQGYSETAVLVDTDGLIQAELRGDGAGPHTLDSAYYKAYTAASFKNDTLPMATRAAGQPPSPLFGKLPNLILFGGGVVIKVGDETLGAIGAGGAPGANLDDGCAKAGLAKIADRLK